MPINQDLLNSIQASLGATITPSLTTADRTADLYESYIFGLVIDAARAENGVVNFYDPAGATPPVFQFRTSPGSIWLPGYCYAEIIFTGKPTLEVHIGVYMQGRSTARHECDVSVIRRTEAQTCRNNQVHPRQNRSEMAAECKMYLLSRLGINLGRSFIGLSVELSALESAFVSNRGSLTIERLLDTHAKVHRLSAIPQNPLRENQLKTWLEQVFLSFKAAN